MGVWEVGLKGERKRDLLSAAGTGGQEVGAGALKPLGLAGCRGRI